MDSHACYNALRSLPEFHSSTEIPAEVHSWRFTPLLAFDAKNKLREWWVAFDGTQGKLFRVYGQINGKPSINATQIQQNLSGLSLHQQALREARRQHEDKYAEGYRAANEPPPKDRTPMLAETWTHTNRRELYFPMGIQPKLDGERSLVRLLEDGSVYFRSRQNKPQSLIQPYLAPAIQPLLALLGPNIELDGELWYPEATSRKIHSIVTNAQSIAQNYSQLRYYIFTYATDQPISAETRYMQITQAIAIYDQMYPNYARFFEQVPMYTVYSLDQIEEKHAEFMSQGYEGSMFYAYNSDQRPQAGNYVYARTTNLMKYKDFLDSEAIIIGVYSGSGTHAGLAIFQVYDPKLGVEFGLAPGGSEAERREYHDNWQKYIGYWINYRYQGLDKTRPRFPTGRGIRTDFEPLTHQQLVEQIPGFNLVDELQPSSTGQLHNVKLRRRVNPNKAQYRLTKTIPNNSEVSSRLTGSQTS